MEVDDFGRIATDKSGENFENYDIIDVREFAFTNNGVEKSAPMGRHVNTPISVHGNNHNNRKDENSNEFLMSVPDMV